MKFLAILHMDFYWFLYEYVAFNQYISRNILLRILMLNYYKNL